MDGHVLGSWQRRLPRRTAASREGHQHLCESPVFSAEPGCGASGWSIWQWGHCRRCSLPEECQGYGTATKKPRRVSAVLWPRGLVASSPSPPPPLRASHPILWGDWERRFHRREWVKLLRHQRVDVQLAETSPPAHPLPVHHLSRAERAHWRLSWVERLARNARTRTAPTVQIALFGLPTAFAATLGLLTIEECIH